MKKNEKKELMELLEGLEDKLKGLLAKEFKPQFKIVMKSSEDGEGYSIDVEGSNVSLLLALTNLIEDLLEETSITKEDIQCAVDIAFEEDDDDEEEE